MQAGSGREVVTRFAPSPSGHLHIGGARTALFNWAFARRMGGRFLLRIEDTDQARSSEASERAILHDLAWLGIGWDEGPEWGSFGGDPRGVGSFRQSERLHLYREHIERLMEQGLAYAAFESPEELDAARKAAIARKETYRYDRGALEIPAAERAARVRAGEPHVVRLRVPDGAGVSVRDEVLGEVSFKPGEVDDFVLMKRDGYPTYHFAVVVDDALMGVTHVLRGQEHLANTPRHVLLQQALGFATPVYAHMPLIFNDKGAKMSKRERDKHLRNKLLSAEYQDADEQESRITRVAAAATLMDFAQIWLASQRDQGIFSDQTIPVYKSYIRSVIKKLTKEDLLEFLDLNVDDLLKRSGAVGAYKDNTLQAMRSALSGLIDYIQSAQDPYGGKHQELHEEISDWHKDKNNKKQLDPDRLSELAAITGVDLPEVSVEDFRSAGYFPEVITNFIALLGYTPSKHEDGSDREKFDLDFLCKDFGIDRLGKSNARFDRVKLASFNADAIGQMDDSTFAERWGAWLAEYDPATLEALGGERLVIAARAVKPRCKVLSEASGAIGFALIPDDAVEFDEKAVGKVLAKGEPTGLSVLEEVRGVLAGLGSWDAAAIEGACGAFAESRGLGMGKVAQPLRVAVTGGTVSPGLGDTLALVGKASVLARIDRCLSECRVG